MTYFKHTSGEAFTLDGVDYVGFFHITDGKAYTDKEDTTTSVELTPKSTMMADVFTNEYEFDTTYKTTIPLTTAFTNVFDLLNKTGLDTLLYTLHNNNLVCFKSLILANPTIYKYAQTFGHYYALSSGDETTGTGVPAHQESINAIPFSDNTDWEFLDNMKVGTFTVDTHENFKYICSDMTSDYILSGNFVDDSPLTKIYSKVNTPNNNNTYHIYNDIDNSRILFVRNNTIDVYDSSNYDECNNLILVDSIKLKETTTNEYLWNTTIEPWDSNDIVWNIKYSIIFANNPEFIKFGKNIRTGAGNNVLYIVNKYSSDIYQMIDLTLYDIGDLLDLDIRAIDDYITILNQKEDGFYVAFLDPKDIEGTVTNTKISSINTALGGQKIRFSDNDSDVFYTYNATEYQSRFISNPEYPAGRLENNNIAYSDSYIWNTTTEYYNYLKVNWNSINEDTNFYNNLVSTNQTINGKMYMILHNIGRIYTLNQNMNDRFLNALPLDTVRYFDGTTCAETSVGVYFNVMISTILKDTLNMFNKSEFSCKIEERAVILQQIADLTLETENLYINGNETLNVITLQRIMLAIIDIQQKILPQTS